MQRLLTHVLFPNDRLTRTRVGRRFDVSRSRLRIIRSQSIDALSWRSGQAKTTVLIPRTRVEATGAMSTKPATPSTIFASNAARRAPMALQWLGCVDAKQQLTGYHVALVSRTDV